MCSDKKKLIVKHAEIEMQGIRSLDSRLLGMYREQLNYVWLGKDTFTYDKLALVETTSTKTPRKKEFKEILPLSSPPRGTAYCLCRRQFL